MLGVGQKHPGQAKVASLLERIPGRARGRVRSYFCRQRSEPWGQLKRCPTLSLSGACLDSSLADEAKDKRGRESNPVWREPVRNIRRELDKLCFPPSAIRACQPLHRQTSLRCLLGNESQFRRRRL